MSSAAAERIAGLVERTPLIEMRGRAAANLAEMRMPADRRRLQAARRDQPAAPAFGGGAEARRRRFLLGQSRARSRHRCPAARDSGRDRDAVRRSAGEGRRHARRRRGDRLLRPPHREPRSDCRQIIARRPAPRSCRASTIRQIVAGQGTVGLEIVDQLAGRSARIIVPCGGGGLASGIALACPDAEIVIVEPEGWDDMRRSLELGEIVPVARTRRDTLRRAADAARVANHLRHPAASGMQTRCRSATMRRVRRCDSPGTSISWSSSRAERSRWRRCWRARPSRADGTVVVLSGGNVDPALHARIVGEAA